VDSCCPSCEGTAYIVYTRPEFGVETVYCRPCPDCEKGRRIRSSEWWRESVESARRSHERAEAWLYGAAAAATKKLVSVLRRSVSELEPPADDDAAA